MHAWAPGYTRLAASANPSDSETIRRTPTLWGYDPSSSTPSRARAGRGIRLAALGCATPAASPAASDAPPGHSLGSLWPAPPEGEVVGQGTVHGRRTATSSCASARSPSRTRRSAPASRSRTGRGTASTAPRRPATRPGAPTPCRARTTARRSPSRSRRSCSRSTTRCRSPIRPAAKPGAGDEADAARDPGRAARHPAATRTCRRSRERLAVGGRRVGRRHVAGCRRRRLRRRRGHPLGMRPVEVTDLRRPRIGTAATCTGRGRAPARSAGLRRGMRALLRRGTGRKSRRDRSLHGRVGSSAGHRRARRDVSTGGCARGREEPRRRRVQDVSSRALPALTASGRRSPTGASARNRSASGARPAGTCERSAPRVRRAARSRGAHDAVAVGRARRHRAADRRCRPARARAGAAIVTILERSATSSSDASTASSVPTASSAAAIGLAGGIPHPLDEPRPVRDRNCRRTGAPGRSSTGSPCRSPGRRAAAPAAAR